MTEVRNRLYPCVPVRAFHKTIRRFTRVFNEPVQGVGKWGLRRLTLSSFPDFLNCTAGIWKNSPGAKYGRRRSWMEFPLFQRELRVLLGLFLPNTPFPLNRRSRDPRDVRAGIWLSQRGKAPAASRRRGSGSPTLPREAEGARKGNFWDWPSW